MAAGDGLVTMTPTSITHAGTSASINADGGVDFTAVTSLSLNGVFVSGIDNYLIVRRHLNGTYTAGAISARLRASGTDASGSNYAYQYLNANSTTVDAARATSQTSMRIGDGSTTTWSGEHLHVYGPYLAQPTAYRCVTAFGNASARIQDWAGTHSLSTSYDGITLIPESGENITGNIVVFGYEE